MFNKMKSLEETLKVLQGIGAYRTINIRDLYLFLDLVIPPKFKSLECEKYDGKTFSILHITMYTRSMVAHIKN